MNCIPKGKLVKCVSEDLDESIVFQKEAVN